jgi:hypothetical protein
MKIYENICKCLSVRVRACMCVRVHARVCVCVSLCVNRRRFGSACARSEFEHPHAYTHTSTHAHTHTRTHLYAYTHTNKQAHTRTHAYTHTRVCTHARAQTHTRARTPSRRRFGLSRPRVRCGTSGRRPWGGGLRRSLRSNKIGGTVPASLSALIALTELCAAPPRGRQRAAAAQALAARGPGSARAVQSRCGSI